MIIDETKLYGADHHQRCLDYIQQFFQENQFLYVSSVYALGSVVTGDYLPGYSDLDIMIITEDTDQTQLMEALRALNNKLWIPTFHLHKPIDFPPPDLYLRIRLLVESKLLYGQDTLAELNPISNPALHTQLLGSLSHRLVMLRSLCCSKAVEKYTPDYTLYYAQKFCLFGLRAWLMMRGDRNTQRKHVIEKITVTETLLTSKNQDFFLSLLTRFEQRDYPLTLADRLLVLRQTVNFLEEIQQSIAQTAA